MIVAGGLERAENAVGMLPVGRRMAAEQGQFARSKNGLNVLPGGRRQRPGRHQLPELAQAVRYVHGRPAYPSKSGMKTSLTGVSIQLKTGIPMEGRMKMTAIKMSVPYWRKGSSR